MIKKNLAAGKLCAWVINIITFNRIYKQVKPLQDEKDRATEDVAQKQKELAVVKERVRVLNEKVANLRRQLEEAEREKQKVESDANQCQRKLDSAEKLVNGLADENKRWGINVTVYSLHYIYILLYTKKFKGKYTFYNR